MRRVLTVFALIVLLTPSLALAQAQRPYNPPPASEDPDGFLVPWIGWHFNNGLSDIDFGDKTRPMAIGATLGFWARNLVSGELEFGYTKNYFGDETLLGTNNLMTFTGSMIIGPWLHMTENQILRPYGVIGGGLARGKIEDFISFGKDSRNRGVIDYGGGLFVYLTKHIGFRGDIRIMRDVGSDETSSTGWGLTDTTYKRMTIGLLLAF